MPAPFAIIGIATWCCAPPIRPRSSGFNDPEGNGVELNGQLAG
jgi:hypothetical protein